MNSQTNDRQPIAEPRRVSRQAFTMLEVLISLAMLVMLMAAAWSMVEMYRDMFLRGERRIERAQIVRSVSQMLGDDLQSAIQDPGNPYIKPDEGTAQVRRFGLAGTSTTLRLDVLQINPFDPTIASPDSGNFTLPIAGPGGSSDMSGTSGGVPMAGFGADPDGGFDAMSGDLFGDMSGSGPRNEPHQIPELKTVIYTFIDPNQSGDYTTRDKPGLTRRELDFETPPETSSGSVSGILGGMDMLNPGYVPIAGAGSAMPGGDPMGGALMPTAGDPMSQSGGAYQNYSLMEIITMDPDLGEMWVPEIVGLKFRYFDGLRWRSRWNSLQQNGLPVAIEAVFEIRSLEQIETFRQQAGTLSGGQRQQMILGIEASMPDSMTRRIVINLPGSPLERPNRRGANRQPGQRAVTQQSMTQQSVTPRAVQPPTIRPPGQPRSGSGQRPGQQVDGWIRTP